MILAPVLSGCTFSIHPVLTKDDLTKDVDLSGQWERVPPPSDKSNSDPYVVVLEGFDSNTAYDAVLKNFDQEFEVRVGKIGDQRILQLVRSDLLLKDDAPVLAKLPVYGFARFELKGDELRVFPVDDQGVRSLLGRQDIAFRDYKPSDMLEWCVISERTSRLQKLIREHCDALFRKEPQQFRRTTPATPETKMK
jgi:hypothetical protein